MSATPSAAAPVGDATSYGFFYGTLMAPEVFFTVCYRANPPPAAIASEHVFRPAVLPGFSRHRVHNEDYPGIIADSNNSSGGGSTVRGMLVTGLSSANIHHLDVFEGSEYERRAVQVQVDGQDELVTAQVYVFKDATALEPREWDFDEFRREKMHAWTRADYTFSGELPATVVS